MSTSVHQRASRKRPGNRAASRPLPAWLLPALLAVTAAAYQPAWFGGPLWDDVAHLTRPDLQSAHGLWRIWFEIGATQQYYPLLHSAFWLCHRLWGDGTLGYHLVNIGLHATSAFLFARVLVVLDVPGAILAAFIFALHPVHVESIAWMSELKNALSGVCYLGAALAFLRFERTRDWRSYAVTAGLFICALLSKSVTSTLPAALLVILWWRDGRVDWRAQVLPLAPFFALGVASGLTTAWVERTFVGANGGEFQFSLIERCLIAGRAVWFYLGKLVWPAGLIFNYPRWSISPSAWWQYLYPVSALAVAVAAWAIRRRSRAPLAALMLFAITLFPALGFFDVYPFRYSFVADHFQYLASLSVIALASAAVTTYAGQARREVRWTAVGATAAVLGFLSWQEAHQYVDSQTLYRSTIARNPESWMAHHNLGEDLLHGPPQQVPEAVTHIQEALRLNPVNAQSHNSLGVAWMRLGRPDEAIREHRKALLLRPGFAEAHYNLGLAHQSLSQLEPARDAYLAAIADNPRYVEARHNLANVLQALGRPAEAIAPLEEAVRLEPMLADTRVNLGNVYLRVNRPDKAVKQYTEALRLNPGLPEVYNNLGMALQQLGRLDDAIGAFEHCLSLMPNSTMVQANLARARQLRGH